MKLLSYDDLKNGAWKVLYLPGSDKPTLTHYVASHNSKEVIKAVKVMRVGDSWLIYADSVTEQVCDYVATGMPIFLISQQEEIIKQTYDKAKLDELIDYFEQNATAYFSIQMGEWENWFKWQPSAFGIGDDEKSSLSRKEVYERVIKTYKKWNECCRGHLDSCNGYGLISHIGAECGTRSVGIETAENIPATQVQRAFARGAARQFGLPWTEQISQWYQSTVPSGAPMPDTDLSPAGVHSTWVGTNTGHSVDMLEKFWVTSWISGASAVNIEAATGYLFDKSYQQREMPEIEAAGLSEYGRRAQKLFEMMRRIDPGIPYTPFGIIVSKYHGRMDYWREPWGNLPETEADVRFKYFFNELFPGQIRRQGKEERYFVTTPFGDAFDVLVNDARHDAWASYPVLIAAGAIDWSDADRAALEKYVEDGGILLLDRFNKDIWSDERLLLDKPGRIVYRGGAGGAIYRSGHGKGMIYTAIDWPEIVPTALMRDLADEYLPARVEGDVSYMFNRTSDGWLVTVLNNKGFTKEPRDMPVIDCAAEERVKITLKVPASSVEDVYRHCGVRFSTENGTSSVTMTMEPGSFRLLLFKELR